MAENQTNIEKADEVTGYLGTMGGIAVGKASPYIGFLTSTPSALTSFGVLVDNMKNGTATRIKGTGTFPLISFLFLINNFHVFNYQMTHK